MARATKAATKEPRGRAGAFPYNATFVCPACEGEFAIDDGDLWALTVLITRPVALAPCITPKCSTYAVASAADGDTLAAPPDTVLAPAGGTLYHYQSPPPRERRPRPPREEVEDRDDLTDEQAEIVADLARPGAYKPRDLQKEEALRDAPPEAQIAIKEAERQAAKPRSRRKPVRTGPREVPGVTVR